MSTSSPQFVTVEMGALKAPLTAVAKSERVSVSVVVRRAVARELGEATVVVSGEEAAAAADPSSGSTKLSIRFTCAEAARIDASARAAGLSRSAYLAGLADAVPVLASGGARPQAIAALNRSSSELSTLSRNVHQLSVLLRIGDVRQALEYRSALSSLVVDVHEHLKQAAALLSQLQSPDQLRRAAGTKLSRRRS